MVSGQINANSTNAVTSQMPLIILLNDASQFGPHAEPMALFSLFFPYTPPSIRATRSGPLLRTLKNQVQVLDDDPIKAQKSR